MHDNVVTKDYLELLSQYKSNIFCAYHTNTTNARRFNIKSKIIKKINGHRFLISDPSLYYLDSNIPDVVNPDIANGLFYDKGGGTVFSALQFILYTHPQKIYLVGCDCTPNGHFYDDYTKNINLLPNTKHLWQEFACIKNSLYPDIEVVSVNPVGLKGLFEDVYTQSYVDAHPELLRENVKIIN